VVVPADETDLHAVVQAVRAGADMVLFNSATPVDTVQKVVSSLVTAVDDGTLPRSELLAAVLHVLAAKHVQICRE